MSKNFFLLPLAFSMALLWGCKETTVAPNNQTTDPNAVANKNADVNSWIYDEMKTYYLWSDQMISKGSTNNKLSPDAYFESLLYKRGELDRFSWIQESSTELKNSLAGKNTVLGVRYSTFFFDGTGAKNRVVFVVAYALKNSPAAEAGLKRSDVIMKVNGSEITTENYTTILNPEQLTLTLGKFNSATNSFEETGKTVNVTKREVQTIPVQNDTIITAGDRKIGYMNYVQFIPGILNSSTSQLGSEFDDLLRTTFAKFKQQGVNELVMDLRYNGGGYISSAVVLSSLIVKNLNPNNVMYRNEWNKQVTDYFTNRFGAGYLTTKFMNESNNLGTLNRLYVLTSRSTASASELIINSLLPYMDVVLIGDNTYGKNVGSITIEDDKKRWNWGMQPITLRSVNSRGESNYGTKDGFTPTVKVSDNKLPFFPLGSPSETLMAAAIAHMTGKNATTGGRINGVYIEKRSRQQATTRMLTDSPKSEIMDMFERLPR